MSKLKLISENENKNENKKNDNEYDLPGDVSVDIKSKSKKLVRTTNGLCRDSLTLYRNFNGLMRNFYQGYYGEQNNVSIIDSQSLRKTSVRHIEGEELDGRVEELDGRAGELDGRAGADDELDKDKEKERHFNQIPRKKDDTIFLQGKSGELKKKRRKRVIVWNAWVVDTSSESSSSESEG